MKKWLLASCAVMAFAATSASATTFDFTVTGLSGAITGTFDGTLDGNLITDLSNISVFLNGVGMNGNGDLFASHYDWSSSSWQTGGGVASLDGTQNNFLFMDVNYPLDGNYTNFFYSVVGLNNYFINYNDNTSTSGRDSTFQAVARSPGDEAQAAVPEPASWALMLGGFGLVGFAMRGAQRKRVSFGI